MEDFIYDLINGIGKIVSKDGSFYGVLFSNGEIQSIRKEDLDIIDNSIIKTIMDGDFEEYFNFQSLVRGEDYYKKGQVRNFMIIGKSISGSVLSERDSIAYQSTITFTKNGIRAVCDCPVGTRCKHSSSILYKVKHDLEYLSNLDSFDNENILYKETNNIVRSNNNQIDYQKFYELNKLINYNDDKSLQDYLNYLFDNNINYLYDAIIRMVLFNDNCQFISLGTINDKKMIPLLRQIKIIKYNLATTRSLNSYNYDIDDIFFASISYNRFDYLKSYIYNSSNTNFKNSFRFLIDHINCDKNFIENYFNYVKRYYNPNDFIDLTEELYKKINDDYVKKLKKEHPEFSKLTKEEIMSNNPSEALDIISNLSNILEAISILITEDEYFYNNSKKKYAKALFNMYLRTHDRRILLLFDRYDDFIYLKALVSNDFTNISYYENNINNIFDTYFNISIDNKDIVKEYKLYLDDELIISLIRHNDSKLNILDDPYIKNINSSFISYVVNKIEEDKDFQAELSNVSERLQITLNKEKYEEYSKAISNLEQNLNRVYLNEKIHLYPKLEITRLNNSYMCYLELKIGNSENRYIVKSIPELIKNVDLSLDYQYGTKLRFNHDINNFDLVSQNLLDLLLSMYSISGTIRLLPIQALLASKIIDIYKGYYINILLKEGYSELLNNEYLISDEYNDIKLKVDNNMKLISEFNRDNTLFLSNRMYYINNNTISKVNLDRNELSLAKFGLNNNGMDLSIVKEKFSEEVLKRFKNQIEVSDDVKKDFRISVLRIDAKFDIIYDFKLIVKLYFYKDDKEILYKEDLSSVDRIHLESLINYLFNLGFVISDDNSKEMILDDGGIVVSFFKMDFKDLKELCNVYLSEDIKNKRLLNVSSVSINVKYENDIFNAFLSDSTYSQEELYEILRAIRQKKKYVLLSDDKIVDLDNEEANLLYSNVSDLGINERECFKSVTVPVYKALASYAKANNINLDDYIKEIHNDIVTFKDKKIKLPNVNANLRKYQIEGFNFMHILDSHNLSGILADDMGLGKTLEVITLFLSNDKVKPSIVVCPKTLIFNWVSEIEKFAPNLRFKTILGNKNERLDIITSIKNDEKIIYITSYDSLRNDIYLYKDIMFNFIILDEAQYIKNVFAQKSKSVKELMGKTRFALTGTPIENNIGDLWSIFDFLMPGYFPELNKFMARYQNNMEALRKVSSPFILRRTKKEVLNDLPDKIETIISCPMSKSQKMAYDAYKLEAKETLDNGGSAMDVLPLLTRLRQICITPTLFTTNYPSDSGKLDMLYKMINDLINEGHKILIFSSFVEALNVIAEHLSTNSIMFHMLTGKTDIYSRKEYVNDFNSINDYKVFLISLKAGGTGLNLVSADTVIHLDPWWNISAENQATDRCYRIGQTRTVNVYKLVQEDSVEERIIELQNTKKDVIDKVISNDDSSITSFSLDDMRFILK